MAAHPQLVNDIPDHIWAALTTHERDFLFIVEDASQGRFGPFAMRERIIQRNKINDAVSSNAERGNDD